MAAGSDEPAVDFGPLAELAGFMLRLAQLRVFEAFYAEFGQRDIRPGQIGILLAIRANSGIRQGALARVLSIKRSNMAKIVRRLEAKGLIRRRVPASDRRSIELHLTPAGSAFVDAVLPDIRANDRAATAVLSASEREILIRVLSKLAGTASPEARA